VSFVALAVIAGCRNQAQVGLISMDGSIEFIDADTENDASIRTDGDVVRDDASSDAGPNIDPSCPRPWVTVVIQDADSARIARLRMGDAHPMRCTDLRAGGELPRTTADAEQLDANTIVAVGPDGIFAIDIATDRVRWTRPAAADVENAQAFAIRAEPPWMGIRWSRRFPQPDDLSAITADGSETRELPWPSDGERELNVVGLSRDPSSSSLLVADYRRLYRVDPFIGLTTTTLISQLDHYYSLTKFHATRGTATPRVAGADENAWTVVDLNDPPEIRSNGRPSTCPDLSEGAPDPQNGNRIFLRCGASDSMYLFWHDVERDMGEVVLGGTSTEPNLTLAGLGVVE
jgi:hypothetical protein